MSFFRKYFVCLLPFLITRVFNFPTFQFFLLFCVVDLNWLLYVYMYAVSIFFLKIIVYHFIFVNLCLYVLFNPVFLRRMLMQSFVYVNAVSFVQQPPTDVQILTDSLWVNDANKGESVYKDGNFEDELVESPEKSELLFVIQDLRSFSLFANKGS